MRPRIDAVAVTSKDFKATVAFYKLIGFEFPSFAPEDQHLEAISLDGEARLMIDHIDLMQSLTGRRPTPSSHSVIALLCESAAQVDAIAASLKAAGHVMKTEPWDAFWGQRYATAIDPDGYEVDLFAEL